MKFIFQREHIIVLHKPLLIFIMYMLITQWAIFAIYGGLNIFRIINLSMGCIFFIIIAVNLFYLDFKTMLNTYIVLGIITTIIIFVQYVQITFYDMHVQQIMLIPIEIPSRWYSEGIRPMGVFPEPQAYATYILPIIVLTLYVKKYAIAIFLSTGIFCSTSSLGILCVCGIWGWHLIFASKRSILIRVAFLLFSLILLVVLSHLGFFSYAFNKIASINFMEDVRLTRGWWLFYDRPLSAQIFGSGINNIKYLIDSGQLILRDSISPLMKHPEYVTSAYELLIFFGILGTIIYLSVIYDLWRLSSIKLLALLLIILSFGQTILFNNAWVQFMFINYLLCKKNTTTFKNFVIKI